MPKDANVEAGTSSACHISGPLPNKAVFRQGPRAAAGMCLAGNGNGNGNGSMW